MAFSCYLGTDRNALLLCKNHGQTSKSFFLDKCTRVFTQLYLCVPRWLLGVLASLCSSTEGVAAVWCGDVSVHGNPEEQTGVFWVCWMVLSGPTAWSSRMCCSRLSSVFLRSRWVLSHPTAIRASAGTAHSEYIANTGFRQRSSTWCFAEPLSCLLLVATCSVSLGHLCS